ncbi:MAG: hypothetical protein AT714_00725 [Vulcanisaeta sp. OSP_8]|nr:MAG: hypothetical protein AT714_00725 [Vulcanisaeta sp. OSP_8]
MSLSGITYTGLITNNVFGTYLGLILFIVFTSYVLTWYLLTSLTLLFSEIVFENGRIEVTIDTSTSLNVRVVSRIPIKLGISLSLIHSPHISSSEERMTINGDYHTMNLLGRWIGDVSIIGGIVSIEDRMGLIRIQGLIISDETHVIVRPARVHGKYGGFGLVGYGEVGTSLEGRLGDLKSLVGYDYERPASTIHWLTSARVNDLIMISRSEYGSCPAVIMDSSSKVLIPKDGKRPIDDFLQIISDIAQHCPEVKVVLISRDHVEQRFVAWDSIPNLEHYVRVRVVSNNMDNAMINVPKHLQRYLGINELLEIAYVGRELNDEATDIEIERAHSIIGGTKQIVLLRISPNRGDVPHESE